MRWVYVQAHEKVQWIDAVYLIQREIKDLSAEERTHADVLSQLSLALGASTPDAKMRRASNRQCYA